MIQYHIEVEYLIAILGIFILILFVLALFIGVFRLIGERQKRLARSLNLTFLKIKKDFFEKPEFSENFYSFLHSLKDDWLRKVLYGQPFFVFEMARAGDDLEFYFGCQRKGRDLILDGFSKFLPDFKTEETQAPNYFEPQERAKGFELCLEKHFVLPIRTYCAENDFLPSIIKVFRESRGKMIMQVLIRPATYSLKEILKKRKKMLLGFGFESLEFLKRKIKKPVFELNVRFLSPAKDLTASEINLIALKKLFEENKDKNYNNLKVKEAENLNEFVFNLVFRIFESYKNVVLNSEELATIFYL